MHSREIIAPLLIVAVLGRIRSCFAYPRASLKSLSAWEYISSRPEYTLFAASVRETGYEDVLESAGRRANGITVFAPTNAAFGTTLRILGYLGVDEGALVALKAVLRGVSAHPEQTMHLIVGYHIVPGGKAKLEGALSTHAGTSLIAIDGMNVLRDVDVSLGDATYDAYPAYPDNAIVYSIHRVLFPFHIDRVRASRALSLAAQRRSDAVCFPASSMVRLADGTKRRMDELQAGDVVHDGIGTSAVYAFTHRTEQGVYPFILLETAQPMTAIALSESHLLYINGSTARADCVHVGDVVETATGAVRVTEKSRVWRRGLYAPHTMQGEIVVDGVLASTYTALVPPAIGHAALAPIRALVRTGYSHEPLGDMLYEGWPSNRPRIISTNYDSFAHLYSSSTFYTYLLRYMIIKL